MADDFDDNVVGLESPAVNGFSVTPHDTNELANYSRALYIGTGGNIKFQTVNGDVVTLVNVADGSYHPWRVKLVYATDTTADDIVAMY